MFTIIVLTFENIAISIIYGQNGQFLDEMSIYLTVAVSLYGFYWIHWYISYP